MAENDDSALADIKWGLTPSWYLCWATKNPAVNWYITWEPVRCAADVQPCSEGFGFFWKDGLLYRLGTLPGCDKEMTTKQLVVPMQCRKAVLEVTLDYQVIWEKERLLNTSRRDITGPHCTGMSRSIAAIVKCARRHCNADPGECHRHPCQYQGTICWIAMGIVEPLPKSPLGKRYTYAGHLWLCHTVHRGCGVEIHWCWEILTDEGRYSHHDSSLTCTVCCTYIQFTLPHFIRKRTALSSSLTKPSKWCYGRPHRLKARTSINSIHSCFLHIGR